MIPNEVTGRVYETSVRPPIAVVPSFVSNLEAKLQKIEAKLTEGSGFESDLLLDRTKLYFSLAYIDVLNKPIVDATNQMVAVGNSLFIPEFNPFNMDMQKQYPDEKLGEWIVSLGADLLNNESGAVTEYGKKQVQRLNDSLLKLINKTEENGQSDQYNLFDARKPKEELILGKLGDKVVKGPIRVVDCDKVIFAGNRFLNPSEN